LVEKKVYVTDEKAQIQGVGQWASYCAVLLDEEGKTVFSDFIVQLYLGTRVVACVYLRPDVYKPTGELCIAFKVPTDFTPGTYRMYLFWRTQMDPDTLITYLGGESAGISYTVVEERRVQVSDAVILHPQAPGEWTSFKCTIKDDTGAVLPEKFYLQIFSSSDTPVHVPISEFLGFTNGVTKRFKTSYKPIDRNSPVKVYIEGEEVSEADYWVGYDDGFIEFYTPPPKGGAEYCPGMSITIDYVAFVTGEFPLGGVYMAKDVYKDGVLQFAFKVPEDFKAGSYPVWLKWASQVIGGLKYAEGESPRKWLVVTTDVRNVIVRDEWIEFPEIAPGEETSYHATVTDEYGQPLPPEVPTELLLDNRVVARAFLYPDVYNPITREVKLAFKVPEDLKPGVYTVRLRWYEYVTGGEL
jgi:hypothetical protein